jgi:hypothetical protein
MLKEFRVSLETSSGPRWFIVEAPNREDAQNEAEEVAQDQQGQISAIEDSWDDDFDPGLHVDC